MSGFFDSTGYLVVEFVHCGLIDLFQYVHVTVGLRSTPARYTSDAEKGLVLEGSALSPGSREALRAGQSSLHLREQLMGSRDRHEFVEEPPPLSRVECLKPRREQVDITIRSSHRHYSFCSLMYLAGSEIESSCGSERIADHMRMRKLTRVRVLTKPRGSHNEASDRDIGMHMNGYIMHVLVPFCNG